MDWKQLIQLLEDARNHTLSLMAEGRYKHDLSAYNEAVGYLRGLEETNRIIIELNNRSNDDSDNNSNRDNG